jgi:hypothetical protein
MYFSFLIYSNNLSPTCFEQTHHQEAVTVYAAYGIYHASALTSC